MAGELVAFETIGRDVPRIYISIAVVYNSLLSLTAVLIFNTCKTNAYIHAKRHANRGIQRSCVHVCVYVCVQAEATRKGQIEEE